MSRIANAEVDGGLEITMYAALALSGAWSYARMHSVLHKPENCCDRVNNTSLGALGALTILLVIYHFCVMLMLMPEADETPPRQAEIREWHVVTVRQKPCHFLVKLEVGVT